MCINKKVVAGLGFAALAVVAFEPHLIRVAIPLLVVAACPLSMLAMMFAMSRGRRRDTGPHPLESAVTGQSTSQREDGAAELRQVREEINVLRAELHLREQRRSGQ